MTSCISSTVIATILTESEKCLQLTTVNFRHNDNIYFSKKLLLK